MAKIAALAAGGDLDIIIADAKTLEHYESQGAAMSAVNSAHMIISLVVIFLPIFPGAKLFSM